MSNQFSIDQMCYIENWDDTFDSELKTLWERGQIADFQQLVPVQPYNQKLSASKTSGDVCIRKDI